MSDTIFVAVIAAIPATVAAVASLRAAHMDTKNFKGIQQLNVRLNGGLRAMVSDIVREEMAEERARLEEPK